MELKEIIYKDRSEFLRGFATIIKKNNSGHAGERSMFIIIGSYFGFEKEFCENALEYLMINKHIAEHPATFSNKLVAEFFIKDVVKILHQTHSVSDVAKKWLRETAEVNKVGFSPLEFD